MKNVPIGTLYIIFYMKNINYYTIFIQSNNKKNIKISMKRN